MDHFIGIIFDPTNKLYQVLLALALGVFVGLRREKQDEKSKTTNDVMGIRTTSLLIILGVVTTFLDNIVGIFAIVFASIFIFMLATYINGVWQLKRYGITAEVSGLLMFLIGVLIGQEQITVAILLAILLGVSSAYKSHIHSFAHHFSLKEWTGTLRLLVISAIILPLLPKEPIDPFGIIVPFDIWMLVIFLSTIGFVGYFFTKYLGERKSMLFISFFGALASSTATTTAIARRSKQSRTDVSLLLAGVLISIAVMQLRVIIEIIVLSRGEQTVFLMPSVVMLITAAIFAVMYFLRARGSQSEEKEFNPNVQSPFEIIPALTFAAFFIIVLFAIHIGNEFFGETGVFISTFIASFADVDAVVFSSLLAFNDGSLTTRIVTQVIALATVVNTAIKLLYIYIFGDKTFFKKSIVPIGLIVFTGIATGFLF